MKKNILLGSAFASMLVFFVMLHLESYTLVKTLFKTWPVVAFALLVGFNTKYRKFISFGLLFSALGDFLLDEYFNLFVPGLGAFLIAHLWYIAAFLTRNKTLQILPALAIYAIGAVALIFIYPGAGSFLIPVVVYMLVITTMGWRAFAARAYNATANLAFIGAMLFIVSDSLIAFNKFYTPIPYHGWLIMISYWAAQYLIFKSAYDKG